MWPFKKRKPYEPILNWTKVEGGFVSNTFGPNGFYYFEIDSPSCEQRIMKEVMSGRKIPMFQPACEHKLFLVEKEYGYRCRHFGASVSIINMKKRADKLYRKIDRLLKECK